MFQVNQTHVGRPPVRGGTHRIGEWEVILDAGKHVGEMTSDQGSVFWLACELGVCRRKL